MEPAAREQQTLVLERPLEEVTLLVLATIAVPQDEERARIISAQLFQRRLQVEACFLCSIRDGPARTRLVLRSLPAGAGSLPIGLQARSACATTCGTGQAGAAAPARTCEARTTAAEGGTRASTSAASLRNRASRRTQEE